MSENKNNSATAKFYGPHRRVFQHNIEPGYTVRYLGVNRVSLRWDDDKEWPAATYRVTEIHPDPTLTALVYIDLDMLRHKDCRNPKAFVLAEIAQFIRGMKHKRIAYESNPDPEYWEVWRSGIS